MRPLGTITMYYPFIDEETKDAIETSMQEASNYYDFVEILSDRVCESKTSDTLKYLAALHAWRLSATEVKRRLSERFGEDPIIKSWTAPHHTMEIDDLLGTLDDAIRAAKEDWLQIELLCLKIWCERYRVVTSEEFWIQPLQEAESILQSRQELECFAALIHTVKSEMGFYSGLYDQGYSSHDKGVETAKKFDDQFQLYQLLWTCASWVKSLDTKRAMALQEEAYKLVKTFGSTQKIAEAMTDMGRISECLGEYDFAISCYENSIETYGNPEMELYREAVDTPSFGLSRVYCELGDGESALDWINTLINLIGRSATEIPYLYSQRAEALILLRRYEEASRDLEISRRVSLRAGAEGNIVLCDIATAYMELAQDDPWTAIKTLEPGLDYLLQRPTAIFTNRILIALTRAEIAANLDTRSDETSEKWMTLLEKHAREKNLPGIIMMHTLLKSEYLVSRGFTEEAINVLKDAPVEECAVTSRTLYERIQSKLRELENL